MGKGGRYLQQSSGSGKKPWLIVLVSVLAVLVLLAALVIGFVYSKMNRLSRPTERDNQLTPEQLASMLVEDPTQEATEDTVPTETTVPKETDPDYGKMGKVINVLLIGQDSRMGEDSKNADTVILITVNKETKVITMTSFLRDSYVTLNNVVDVNGKPHSGSTKLTLAYALGYSWGGDKAALDAIDQVVKNNFGPEVDHNIEVSMDAFDECINLLKGIEIELTADEAKYMNNYFKDYPDRVYSEGVNKLDGWAAETYARTRHSNAGDNDYNRTQRQRNVISAVLEKVKNMNLLDINNLIDQLLPLVVTDMSNSDIINYVTEILPILPQCTLESIQCPNFDMDMGMWGETKDLFGDGIEHSIQHFNSEKVKAILTPITEAD